MHSTIDILVLTRVAEWILTVLIRLFNINITHYLPLELVLLKDVPQLWWPIAAIKKKLSKSRKNFHNREKTYRIKKTILEFKKKKLKSRKKLRNRKKKFKIKKNISESGKKF